MRKIFCALTLSMLSFLVVYCGKIDENKPLFGSTYSEPIEVGDFLYCLRSDGYYQCIGLSKSGFEAKALMVPDYVNGIPVMGFGIPREPGSTSTPTYPYNRQDIILEYDSHSDIVKYKIREKVNGNSTGRIIYSYYLDYEFYDSYFDKDKDAQYLIPDNITYNPVMCSSETIYFNCHHVNGLYDLIGRINGYGHNPRVLKKIVFEPNYINDSNYDYFHTYYSIIEGINCTEYSEFYDLLFITSPFSLKKIAETELYWHELRFQFRIYDDDEFIKALKGSTEPIEAWEMTYAEKMEKMKSRISSNVEFRYNLMINGQQYIREGYEDRYDEEYDERDLYWIDYVSEGEKIQEPPVPYVNGYDFLGWYTDSKCTNKWDFSADKLNTASLKLYAKWNEIK